MKKTILTISLLALVIITAACTTMDSEKPTIKSFKACEVAGGNIAESYPRQCMIDGQTFLEEVIETGEDETSKYSNLGCEAIGGTWIPETEECEGIGKDSCEELGGNFNECASACRNDPEAQMCTMQCVLVCEFAEEEVKTNPIPENCISWYDGCNTCGAKDGELTMCTLMYCEEPMGEAKCLAFAPETHTCTDEEIASKMCTREYVPVCGDDGKTYGNDCTACSSGAITSWTEGEC